MRKLEKNEKIKLFISIALVAIDSAIMTIVKNLNEKQKGEVLSFCATLIGKKGE